MPPNRRLLLDTPTLLWAGIEPEKLGRKAEQAILDPAARLFVSEASIWELQTKHASGELSLPDRADFVVERIAASLAVELLPIRLEHIRALYDIPPSDHGPLTRMKAAQARHENLALVTPNPAFSAYGQPIVW